MCLLAELVNQGRLHKMGQTGPALALVGFLRAEHLRIIIADDLAVDFDELCFAARTTLLGLVAQASLQLAQTFVLVLRSSLGH